jgi:hypothetical protein
MHELMRIVPLLSAADTPNIDSAGATSEFIPGLPFVVTRVGIVVTTEVNPDNSVAMTAALSRRPTIGSSSGEVALGTFAIMAAAAANLAVGTVVYKDLHIDDEDGETPEDYDANTSRAKRNEAPNSNLTAAITDQNPYLIPASQSFCMTLDTNAEADSGAVRSFVEGYYVPLTAGVVLSTAALVRDTSDEA